MDDLRAFVADYQDYLAPRLDTYEQAIYLYVFRHSRLLGLKEITIGFKSARKNMAFGVGEKGKPMSEGTVYSKLQSLEAKGGIRILGSERTGTRLSLLLPTEIDGVVPPKDSPRRPTIEDMDFFTVAQNRALILEREHHRCFYCGKALDKDNYVIEHVVSRPEGHNGYTNVVAACRECNNRKGETPAEDYFRLLYRESILSTEELKERFDLLGRLRDGLHKPTFAG